MHHTINGNTYLLDKVKNGFTYLKNVRTGNSIPFSEQDLKNYKIKIK